MRSLFFFAPLAVLLAHCDFSLSEPSHTHDECAIDDRSTCHGNSVRECEEVPETIDRLENDWVERPCDDISRCVEPNGDGAHCVGNPCANDSDCGGKGVCRDQHCALYFETDYTECSSDPQRCPPSTICAHNPGDHEIPDGGYAVYVDAGDAGDADGGAPKPCTGTSCVCIAQHRQ